MAKAGLNRKTWADRMVDCQLYYTGARSQGQCKKCGKTNCYLKAGAPGQPVKLYGPDLEKLKAAIQRDGWVCQSCSLKVRVEASVPEVPKKSWAPYPLWLQEIDAGIQKQLKIMATGSDGYGIRTAEDTTKYLEQQRRLGWVPEDEWFGARAAPVPGENRPRREIAAAGAGVTLTEVGV